MKYGQAFLKPLLSVFLEKRKLEIKILQKFRFKLELETLFVSEKIIDFSGKPMKH